MKRFVISLALFLTLVALALVWVARELTPRDDYRSYKMTAYRIDGTYPDSLHSSDKPTVPPPSQMLYEWPILQEVRELDEPSTARIIEVLHKSSTYGDISHGAGCFWPGLAFRYVERGTNTEVVLCLHCSWARFYRGGVDQEHRVLSKKGADRLNAIYEDLFPKSPLQEGALTDSNRSPR